MAKGMRKQTEDENKNVESDKFSYFDELVKLKDLVSPRDKEIIERILEKYRLLYLFKDEYGENFNDFNDLLKQTYILFKSAYISDLASNFIRQIQGLETKMDKKIPKLEETKQEQETQDKPTVELVTA